ncbi:BlaI/MecI/CopY family transcriptional regulator [Anthocerotibacter panamensis]|uniref:BlaI/MecI/CopY family transcriptional regulator n=1 Tax=Anthocerotibacter panamensis TaxID=2857077 RepID=UPI001C402AA3|nr:BlaI/MecI/CopY family transcriptional regulator [Anthocerotibacter panamensis]
MPHLPGYRPNRLSLGPLEREILEILWDCGPAATRDVYERLLADPDRELACASVMTVLKRLTQKGWLTCDETGRAFLWQPTVSRAQAQALEAHDQLQKFLQAVTPEAIAAFADHLDPTSVAQLQSIARSVEQARAQQQAQRPIHEFRGES